MTPGQVAYEAYSRVIGRQPKWEDVSDETRVAWHSAALAAVAAALSPPLTGHDRTVREMARLSWIIEQIRQLVEPERKDP